MRAHLHFHPKDCLPPHGEDKLPSFTRGDVWFLAVMVTGILVAWAILG